MPTKQLAQVPAGAHNVYEPKPYQRLRLNIEKATLAEDAEAVLALLRVGVPLEGMDFDGKKLGLEVLAGGFGGGMRDAARKSFASYCIEHSTTEVLAAVLRSDLTTPAELLKAVCSWRRTIVDKKKTRSTDMAKDGILVKPDSAYQDLWTSSFARNSVDGIRVAFEFDSDAKELHVAEKRGLLDQGDTLHAQALGLALSYLCSGKFWGVKPSLDILELFREHKTPVARAHSSNYLLDLFVSSDCPVEYHAEFSELFGAYVKAGYIDEPNRRLTAYAGAKKVANLLPLTGAILLENKPIAIELVRAGADSTRVGADVGEPEMGAADLARNRERKKPTPDLRSKAQRLEDAEEFAAVLTAAIMEQTIANAPAPEAQCAVAARSRRMARAV